MRARWDRMAKAFTRVSREIVIAVKAGGENPDHNPALRRAIQNGRAVNMPRDKVEAAIKRWIPDATVDEVRVSAVPVNDGTNMMRHHHGVHCCPAPH